ncbi:hypothetical protein D3C86_1406610 [compost metagenome]
MAAMATRTPSSGASPRTWKVIQASVRRARPTQTVERSPSTALGPWVLAPEAATNVRPRSGASARWAQPKGAGAKRASASITSSTRRITGSSFMKRGTPLQEYPAARGLDQGISFGLPKPIACSIATMDEA